MVLNPFYSSYSAQWCCERTAKKLIVFATIGLLDQQRGVMTCKRHKTESKEVTIAGKDIDLGYFHTHVIFYTAAR